MKVLNVNSTLNPKSGGGTAERTFQMSKFLAKHNVQCTVLTLDIEIDDQRVSDLTPAKIVIIPCLWRRFYLPKVSWKVIRQLVDTSDLIHIMGHWGALNALVYLAVRLSNKPYVVCPAGALPLYGRSKFIKIIYNWVIGKAIIQNASGWIAVTQSEFPQFEAYGITQSKVTVIPNGINLDNFPYYLPQVFKKKFNLSDLPIILFMGRLNFIKGPDVLLDSFVKMQSNLNNYQLVFVGPGDGMLSKLQEQAQKSGLKDSVRFLGYLGGNDKSMAYHAAKLMVVPSRQEAMSIVALEAMVCGCPVILTDQCGFPEVREISPLLEVPIDSEKMKENILKLLSNETELQRIASVLKEFAINNYSWDETIQSFISLYKKILKAK